MRLVTCITIALNCVLLSACGPLKYLESGLTMNSGDDSNLKFFLVYAGQIKPWGATSDQKAVLGIKATYRAKEDEDTKYGWSDQFEQQSASLDNFRLEKLNSDGTVEKLIPFSRAVADLEFFDGKKLATDLYLDDLTTFENGTYRFSVNQIARPGEKINPQSITFIWPLTQPTQENLPDAYEAFYDGKDDY